ncbi:MAG: hypothetical protein Q7J44_22760 [Pseudotabrizicola sp.]|uniref:hypothetical protein n=1 Tax=Pseudotabrizicola sp. TaxID=2939647 RepID=UPI002715FF1E|nr:hypothetical protein [Pseudotabrizicola sp.]MDO9641357.1 hypothetical protein [Pseudotabrizicola sp.]
MLEGLALSYSQLSDGEMRAVGYGLVILGGIVGGVTNRSLAEIRRSPYFALSGLVFLCVSAVSLANMGAIVQAIVGGFFWTLVVVEMLTSLIAGFFFAKIAAARSRDAYGHGRMAALAFIPIANLWLLLTPSKNEASTNRAPTIPLLTGGIGVLSGLVMFGAGSGLSAYAQEDGIRRVEEAATAGVFSEVMLDRNLATMAAEVQTPMVVDETTTLARMEALGTEMRYIYEVDPPPSFLSAEMRIGLMQRNCTYEGFSSVIDAGAVIKHIYLRRDGSEIGVVEVTKATCGR